jgi:hypothetical protein
MAGPARPQLTRDDFPSFAWRTADMKKILAIGEILVEIVATERGPDFRSPVPLIGPFPSGAPAIFIDQAARLGHPCAIVSAVGDDDFGRCNLDRLKADGVDISGVTVAPDGTTGSAFVRYRDDGSRTFVYNIRNSACGRIDLTQAALRLIDESLHLHVTGTSLYSTSVSRTILHALHAIKGKGGTVSFDPNIRPEIVQSAALREALEEVMANADLFLPSGNELFLFTRSTTPDEAVAELLQRGIAAVIWKQGSLGATYFDREGSVTSPAILVEELDPTGAGDCFGAAFVCSWLQGAKPEDALRCANAAGAHAVTKVGPMEGAATYPQLCALLGK